LEKSLYIYKSSAGSGKTFTLVLKYISLLLTSEDLHKFKKILAVTFTNKASNEMKVRVVEALESLKLQNDQSFLDVYVKETKMTVSEIQQKASYLLSIILHNYGEFNILTIDKFVHRIIRSFSRELGMSSNFELETEEDDFYKRSIDTLLSELGHNEELTKVLVQYSQSLINEDEKGSVEKGISSFVQAIRSEEGKKAIAIYKGKGLDYFMAIDKDLSVQLKDIKSEVVVIIKWVLAEFGDLYKIFGNRKNIGNWIAKINDEDYGASITDSVVNLIEDEKWLAKKVAKDEPAFYSKVESLSVDLKKQLQAMIEALHRYGFYKTIKKNMISFSLLNSIQKILNEIKEERNIIFISDFNQIISNVVKEESAPYIYEKIGNRFEHYFIDEFQDTSKLQWHNIIPLLFESLSEQHLNLIVGDAKQSIYRFRGGEVKQFVDLPKVNADIKDLGFINAAFDRNHNPEVLNTNYRSSTAVIEFNNWFFTSFTENESDYVKSIYKDVIQEFHKEKQGYVQIDLLDKIKGEELTIEEKILEKLLESIDGCLEGGYEASDITILVKSKAKGKIISEFLLENKHKIVSVDSLVLDQSQAVNCIVAHLDAFDDTQDLTILKCFKYLDSEHSLMELFEKYRIPAKKAYYSQGFDFDRYIRDFLPEYDGNYYRTLSLVDRIDYLVYLFNFPRTDAYIDKLMNFAFEFQKRNNGNLSDFITLFDERKSKEAVNIGVDKDAIQLMTIHKSKGLQFPIVMIPFDFSENSDDFAWVQKEELTDLGLKNYPLKLSKDIQNYGFQEVYEESSAESKLDILNLYYVAFTRPEDRLYVISSGGRMMAKTVRACMTNSPNLNDDKNQILYGEKNVVHKKEESIEVGSHSFPEVKSWRKSDLALSVSPLTFEEDYQSESEQEIGEAIHFILSKSPTTIEIENQKKRFLLNNFEWKDKFDRVTKRLSLFADSKEVNDLYNNFDTVIIEQAMLSENGKEIRPDRVNVLKDKLIVIDFKTGIESDKHIQQITDYGFVLASIYNLPVEKVLIYLSDTKVELKYVR